MSKLGKRLIKAAKSAQVIARGEADPKTYKVHVPPHLDVRAIRTKLKMSQNAFAARFGILPSTLRDWEQNRRHPDGAARDAARRVVNAAEAIGIRGILVHAISDDAKAFYLALGFEPSPIEPMTLMATLTDIHKSLA